jgi:hypothetical protein
VKALGLKANASPLSNFKDIDQNDWYYKSISIASNASLINGYEDGTFHSSDQITHQEALAMLTNSQHAINPSYKLQTSEVPSLLQNNSPTIQVDDWAQETAALALKHNIVCLIRRQ